MGQADCNEIESCLRILAFFIFSQSLSVCMSIGLECQRAATDTVAHKIGVWNHLKRIQCTGFKGGVGIIALSQRVLLNNSENSLTKPLSRDQLELEAEIYEVETDP